MRARVDEIPPNEAHKLLGLANLDEDGRACLSACLFCSSHIWAGYAEDDLACIWGLCPPTLMSDCAYLWLYIETEAIKDREFTFVRRSQIEMAKMLEYFPIITGHCVPQAEQSKRWLRLLGARFGEPVGGRQPFQISRRSYELRSA